MATRADKPAADLRNLGDGDSDALDGAVIMVTVNPFVDGHKRSPDLIF